MPGPFFWRPTTAQEAFDAGPEVVGDVAFTGDVAVGTLNGNAVPTEEGGVVTQEALALHTVNADAHHDADHSIASHDDTTATGAELETLTSAGNADALHKHNASNVDNDSAVPGVGVDDALEYLATQPGGGMLIAFGQPAEVTSGQYLNNAAGTPSNVVGAAMQKNGKLITAAFVNLNTGPFDVQIYAGASLLTTISLGAAEKKKAVTGLSANFNALDELNCKINGGTADKPHLLLETLWR